MRSDGHCSNFHFLFHAGNVTEHPVIVAQRREASTKARRATLPAGGHAHRRDPLCPAQEAHLHTDTDRSERRLVSDELMSDDFRCHWVFC